MSDLLAEDRLTLAELARLEGVNVCTVWRWAQRGVRGVKLETFSVGGRRFTTRGAHGRFAEGCTVAAQGTPSSPAPRTNRQREAAVRKAEAELAKAGV
jgi:hypothetical protein